MHWCRRRVRFNKVPEKVPKVPEKVWEALVQSQVRFNRVPEKVLEKVPEKVPAKVWEALVQSQVRFNSSGKGSGEGLGGFGAEPERCNDTYMCIYICSCTNIISIYIAPD